ncbi:basic proline-rich protein-like isoform X1 [Pollicipes pollicipes]|uniref:basic proline-rich protein-like isoform X1 n=1 Tax=Pollicipes pollicipes TaxID=41117 RepID=UPI001884EE96|nr:basic proline-rich protein-like isoform X1 [Pollicipes pollicipes]
MASSWKAPLVICGVNINAIREPAQLHQLLQQCEDFDDKNKIFARLMDIMPGGPEPAADEPCGPGPTQYTCSIVTQETQTAELPPGSGPPGASPLAAGSDGGRPVAAQDLPGPDTAVWSDGSRPPWARHGRVAAPPSPEDASSSSGGSQRPPWARRGRSDRSSSPEERAVRPTLARTGRSARPQSLEEAVPAAAGSQLPWARPGRCPGRASSVSRLASAFSAEEPPPPPNWARQARLEKARSLYAASGEPAAAERGPAPAPSQQRKMSLPHGPAGATRALARSRSEEQICGGRPHGRILKQEPFHMLHGMRQQTHVSDKPHHQQGKHLHQQAATMHSHQRHYGQPSVHDVQVVCASAASIRALSQPSTGAHGQYAPAGCYQ